MRQPDEFDYGDTLPSGRGDRFLAAFVCGVFLVSIFGTAVLDNFFPVKGLLLIGAERAKKDQMDREATLWDGTLAKRFEDNLHARSRVRSLVLPPYSYALFRYLDEAPKGILVGKEHWMFLQNRIELAPFSDQFLAGSLISLVISMDRLLAAQGVALAVLPIPRKSTIAQDFLPTGVDGRLAVDDLIIDGFVARGLTTADMRAAYAGRDPEEIYFKLDTHWTPTGAKLAAERLARVAGFLKPPEMRLGSLDTTRLLDPTRMGVATLLSIGVTPKDFDLEPLDLYAGPDAVATLPPGLIEWYKAPSSMSLYMLVGTSFSVERNLAQMLSHFTGTPVQDEAQRAQPFMKTFHNGLVRATRNGGLRQLFWEIPIGVAFSNYTSSGVGFSRSVGDSILAVPVQTRIELGQLLPSGSLFGQGKPVSVDRGRRQLIRIPAGVLGHSGDGVASLRLKGEAKNAAFKFQFVSDKFNLSYFVNSGPFDIDLPVLTSGSSSAGIRVFVSASKPGGLRIDEAVLEHIPVGTASAELVASQTPTGQELRPLEPIRLGHRAALVLQGVPGGSERGQLDVTITTRAPGGSRKVSFANMNSACSIALDLGGEGGRLLESVSIDTDIKGFAVKKSLVTGLRE